MSEPDISTLARRLAEQNNVDWRVLRGSGPHGKVVERDVLDFLAKVMAGEEAINPTPEPVPEGMEAWPDQDIQGFRTGLGEAATLGELRDELGNASRDYFDEPGDESAVVDERVVAGSSAVTFGGAEPHAYGGAATDFASGSTPVAGGDGGIDEDIFLFEDEAVLAEDAPAQSVDLVGADDADPRTPTLVDEDAVAPASDDLDELLVAGDDFDADETAGEVDTYATSSHDSRFGGVPTGYLSDDDDSDSQPGALGVSTSDEGFTDVRFTEEEQVAPAPTTSGADWGDEISFGADGGAAHEQGAAVPDLWGPEATAQTDDSDLWTGPSGTSIDAFTDTRSGDTGMEEEAAWPADSVGAFTDSLEADTAATGAYSEQADPIQVAGTAFDESTDVGLAAVGATLLSAGTATLPLARPGTILRRNIDVSALAAAQLAVGQELGFDEPIGASAFLLRAVVKAATSTGYSTGAVGLAVLEEGVSIRRVDGAAEMPFTQLVGLIGSVDVEEDEPVLVAADLSGLDVDEAVLELETPVISLGRILYDNQRGAYRSTLSLTGPIPLDTAASLLARVAELLDAPVRLVL